MDFRGDGPYNKNVRKGSSAKKVALAGVLSALSVAVMMIGCATGVMDLTAVTVASLFSVIAVMEAGAAWGISLWAVVSVLSFLLLPDKFVFAEYMLFGGLYPILKLYFERIPGRVFEWAAKLGYAAATVGLLLLAELFVLRLPREAVWVYVTFGCGFMVFFIVYDLALTRALTLYVRTVRPKLKFLRGMK